MNTDEEPVWSWELGADPEEVHRLICACDAYQATQSVPAPRRTLETTHKYVRAGLVHVLRRGNEAVATFTLSLDPLFHGEMDFFPRAQKPAYLARLAVKPEWLASGSLVGVRCLRKVVELARSAAVDALRSEANPDIVATRALLGLFGFEEYHRVVGSDGLSRVYLQKTLAGEDVGRV